jgi:hypothetical protein
MKNFIAPGHARWDEFARRLEGPEGCFFREKPDGGYVWDCDNKLTASKRILRAMGCNEDELRVTLDYFQRHGGYCDCEVLMNVDPAATNA